MKINYNRFPEKFRGGVRRYVERGIEPGMFLKAVLANSLVDSFAYGDCESIKLLPTLCSGILNYLPGECWGGWDDIKKWVQSGGLIGQGVEIKS